MITEDYVSFEVAKLLKEKGFDAECDYLYSSGELVRALGGACNWNGGETLYADYKNECSAPTLQMTMKWLREVHNIQVVVSPYNTLNKTWSYHAFRNFEPLTQRFYVFDTYEEACETVIKYCIKNLI